MTTPAGEWVTVAEAARRLGVAPRQARRWAEKLAPEDRDTSVVPVLVSWAAMQQQQRLSHLRDRDRDTRGQSPPPGAVAGALERIVSEQAARLAEQKALYEARVRDLQEALESERRHGQQLAEALAREQMLRALENSLPPPVTEQLSEPNTEPNTEPKPEPVGEAAAAPMELAATPDAPGWWARLWNRMKD